MSRKTKIIATLGPAVASQDAVIDLAEAGMNVARLNFSHGDHEVHQRFSEWVRHASDRLERAIAVLQDVQGPRIRVGTFPGSAVEIATGDTVTLTSGTAEGDARTIYVENLDAAALEVESPVLLSDGLIALEVTGKTGGAVKAKVIEGGVLRDHKGAVFPGCAVDIPSVSEKDEADLAFGAQLGVDFVAASFVSSADDVRRVRQYAAPGTPVIAKIESAIGYDNLDEILGEADGAMVARGDLGVELSFQSVPWAQKDILARTNAKARLSITATEMLESMTNSPRPTRAEVTDVSAAVLDGSDAVMLSAETAAGKYPIRAVEAMSQICLEAEQRPSYGRRAEIEFLEDAPRFASATAQACVDAAASLDLQAIVAFTESGSTARLISKYRSRADIYAYTPHEATYRRMALYSGVTPLRFFVVESTDEMILYAERNLLEAGIVKSGEGIVMAAGIPPNKSASTNLMKLHTVGATAAGVPGAIR